MIASRGAQIDVNVEREVLNHKTLVHPNIVQFREARRGTPHRASRLPCTAGRTDPSLYGLCRPHSLFKTTFEDDWHTAACTAAARREIASVLGPVIRCARALSFQSRRANQCITQVFLTETHLAVALEYADGGELFDAVAAAGKLPEIEVGIETDCQP